MAHGLELTYGSTVCQQQLKGLQKSRISCWLIFNRNFQVFKVGLRLSMFILSHLKFSCCTVNAKCTHSRFKCWHWNDSMKMSTIVTRYHCFINLLFFLSRMMLLWRHWRCVKTFSFQQTLDWTNILQRNRGSLEFKRLLMN